MSANKLAILACLIIEVCLSQLLRSWTRGEGKARATGCTLKNARGQGRTHGDEDKGGRQQGEGMREMARGGGGHEGENEGAAFRFQAQAHMTPKRF